MSVKADGAQPSLRVRVAIFLGTALLRVLGATWRLRSVGREEISGRNPGEPRVVFSLWHGQMLPILYNHREPTAVMISEHRDGEIIARVVEKFGLFAFRGSSSRGGSRALLEGVRLLDTVDVAITPDGPRGPRHSYAPGALLLAFRAGVDICPVVAYADRAWVLNSWDGFEIPAPFAKVTVLYGKRTPVVAENARSAAEQVDSFRALMDTEALRLRQLAGASSQPE